MTNAGGEIFTSLGGAKIGQQTGKNYFDFRDTVNHENLALSLDLDTHHIVSTVSIFLDNINEAGLDLIVTVDLSNERNHSASDPYIYHKPVVAWGGREGSADGDVNYGTRILTDILPVITLTSANGNKGSKWLDDELQQDVSFNYYSGTVRN